MTDDMRVWVRAQIVARNALAEEAHGASWTVAEYLKEHPDGGADSYLALVDADEETELFSVTVPGSGADEEDLAHIAFNDPRQIIADCEYDLATLDEHRRLDEYFPDLGFAVSACCGCAFDSTEEHNTPDARDCPVVKRLAYRYRHRPGYLAEWAPEGVTP